MNLKDNTATITLDNANKATSEIEQKIIGLIAELLNLLFNVINSFLCNKFNVTKKNCRKKRIVR